MITAGVRRCGRSLLLHHSGAIIPGGTSILASSSTSLSSSTILLYHASRSLASSSSLPSSSSSSPIAPKAGPMASYNQKISAGILRNDPFQRKTVQVLQELHDSLIQYNPPSIVDIQIQTSSGDAHKIGLEQLDLDATTPFSFLSPKRWFQSASSKAPRAKEVFGPQGLYVYGSVGTGKTMTMDMFYHSINVDRKRRVHFHAFMLDVHKRVHELRRKHSHGFDPIPPIAQELANQAWLLCFDELQVTDITDAMLLRRLFYELFTRGVVVFTTSNRHPDELYKNGIQRSSFIPTIELLKSRCLIHSLDSGTDYPSAFFHPLEKATTDKVDRLWRDLTNGQTVQPRKLDFFGRSLIIKETAGTFAKAEFKSLCGQPLSAPDFLSLAQEFNLLILTNVPKMSFTQRNEARRFITLIDALYENKVKLIISAEAPPDELLSGEGADNAAAMSDADRLLQDDLKLSTHEMNSSIFTGAEENFAFRRAVSRLFEMQSLEWIGQDLSKKLDRLFIE
ncbi:AFG1-like ATPase-domain-containing protein [Chytridium lagenaria]|nr:AFG1-like ATPase-domain-containing protein [Chytridium lagenaria]